MVSVILKRPVLPLCVVDGRSRNPLYYYYYYYYEQALRLQNEDKGQSALTTPGQPPRFSQTLRLQNKDKGQRALTDI